MFNKTICSNGFKIRLRYLIQSSKLSIEELSLLIGVSKKTIYRWEYEDLCFPRYTSEVKKLADVFNVNIDWLIIGISNHH